MEDYQPNQQDLWHVFNLGENNPDQGAGILYCLRYSVDRIHAHQESVISTLQTLGVTLEDAGQDIYAHLPKNGTDIQRERVYILFEELSCLNEAMEYVQAGFNQFDNVEDLKNGLVTQYFGLLQKGNLAEAYDLVDLTIPEIAQDLRVAHLQNKVHSSQDLKNLEELVDFSRRQVNNLNHPMVLFG